MPIVWPNPKVIKLGDVVTALEDLEERVTENRAIIDNIVAAQAKRISELEHFAEAHAAGATERQAEIDQVRAQLDRQAWYQRVGRRP